MMSYEAVGKLVDKWMTDAAFREAVRKNPKEAVRGTGVALTQEEWQALEQMDWNVSDEELKIRVSKAM